MIHRDMKHSYSLGTIAIIVYVMGREVPVHVYLTDMGMAKVKFSCSILTEAHHVGTPYYAAPETFEEVVGKPSDAWSLVILMPAAYLEKRQDKQPVDDVAVN